MGWEDGRGVVQPQMVTGRVLLPLLRKREGGLLEPPLSLICRCPSVCGPGTGGPFGYASPTVRYAADLFGVLLLGRPRPDLIHLQRANGIPRTSKRTNSHSISLPPLPNKIVPAFFLSAYPWHPVVRVSVDHVILLAGIRALCIQAEVDSSIVWHYPETHKGALTHCLYLVTSAVANR